MYSPKICEALIPRLYQLAKQRKTTMTALVDAPLEKALNQIEQEAQTEASGQDDVTSKNQERSKRRKQQCRIAELHVLLASAAAEQRLSNYPEAKRLLRLMLDRLRRPDQSKDTQFLYAPQRRPGPIARCPQK